MKKIKYIGLLFFLTVPKLLAKVDSLYDSSRIPPINLSQKPSEIYTGRDFIYEDPIQEPSVFMRFFLWIYHKIIEFLSTIFNFDLKAKTLYGREILWILLLTLLIILLVIGIVFFYKKFHGTLGRNNKNNLSAEEAEKNIHVIDFDELIDTAVENKNYRLAIRFYYLKLLKLMADQQLIQYEYQKTNYEYFYEINNPELKKQFKELSFVFDYCWYGDHLAGETDFIIAKNKFSKTQRLVSKL